MANVNWKRWGKRLGITLTVLFILYVLFGFWGVPLLLRHVGLAKLNEQVAGHGEVEAFRFNPFTWELKVEQFTGYTPDGAEVMRFREFRINVQPTSVFGEELAALEIILDEPYLNLVIDENGQPNIASALTKLQEQVSEAERAAAESKEPFVIPPLRIGAFHVINAGLRTEINSFGEPFVREMKDVSFVMDDVRTSSAHDNPYQFQLVTERGEKFSVGGELRLDPLSSWGQVSIEQLQLEDFLVFAGNRVGFQMEGGALDFSISFAFSPLGQNPRLDLTEGHMKLTGLSLTGTDDPEPFQSVGRLELQGLGIDVLHDQVTLDSFELEDSMLRVVRGDDGVLNLIRYLAPPERQAEIAEAVQQEAAAEKVARQIRLGVISDDQDLGVALTSAWEQVQELVGLKWDLSVKQVAINGVALTWRDEYLATPAEFRWSDISLTSSSLNNGNTPFPYDLSLAMNESGRIGLHGQFTATPASSDFELMVTELPLAAISPYIEGLAPVKLASGLLSATGKGEIAFPDEGLPELSAEIDSNLKALDVQWATGDPLLAWENLQLSGVSATTKPMSVNASQVSVTAPVVHVERQSNGALRLPMPEATAADANPTASAPPADPASPTPTPRPEFTLELDELAITGGTIHVRDVSVSPPVNFALTNYELTAAPLSYPQPQPMTLDVSFKLAEGPAGAVKVSAALNPLDPMSATEFKIDTQGVTLAPFAAYAVPVIGQPPTQGQLSASLGYAITEGAITGQNKMKIKTVRFGDRPEGIEAPDLPLGMGVAILEDREGFMNIDIPVQGDVNDPSFSLDAMISYAIGNVLEKIATAPFAAIGSLGDLLPGDDQKYIPFEAGSAELSLEMREVLSTMGADLSNRPALVTTLSPSIDPEADAEALRAQQFKALLKDTMARDEDDEEDATETIYQSIPWGPGAPPASELNLEQQQKAIQQAIDITQDDLARLSLARAEAVRSALVDAGLDPRQVVIPTDQGFAEDGARVNLGAQPDLAATH